MISDNAEFGRRIVQLKTRSEQVQANPRQKIGGIGCNCEGGMRYGPRG